MSDKFVQRLSHNFDMNKLQLQSDVLRLAQEHSELLANYLNPDIFMFLPKFLHILLRQPLPLSDY